MGTLRTNTLRLAPREEVLLRLMGKRVSRLSNAANYLCRQAFLARPRRSGGKAAPFCERRRTASSPPRRERRGFTEDFDEQQFAVLAVSALPVPASQGDAAPAIRVVDGRRGVDCASGHSGQHLAFDASGSPRRRMMGQPEASAPSARPWCTSSNA